MVSAHSNGKKKPNLDYYDRKASGPPRAFHQKWNVGVALLKQPKLKRF